MNSARTIVVTQLAKSRQSSLKKPLTKSGGDKVKKPESSDGEVDRFSDTDDKSQHSQIVNLDTTENIYNFVPEDFAVTMERALLNPDVKYRMEPASKRHRGLTPMMIALLAFVHKTARLADRRGQKFYGLTQVQYQNAFSACGISNDTVRDNVRKLSKNWSLLAKIDVIVDKKPTTYYNINIDRFPCKDGVFLFGEEGDGAGNRFWAIHCPEYPFCSCVPKDCLFIADLDALMGVLQSGFLGVLKTRLKSWTEASNAIKEISLGLPEILRRDTDDRDYFSMLTDGEVDYFAEMLYKARMKDKNSPDGNEILDDDLLPGKNHYESMIEKIRGRIASYFDSNPPEIEEKPVTRKKIGKETRVKKAPLDFIP